jgi:hypothetical protein
MGGGMGRETVEMVIGQTAKTPFISQKDDSLFNHELSDSEKSLCFHIMYLNEKTMIQRHNWTDKSKGT